MAKTVTKYSIFIASPSDLAEERIAIEEVLHELNLTFGKTRNLVLELLKWETHSAPGISNSHPQALINNDLGDDYDIFIGMLWKRFGTPTDKAGSGTEEEFTKAFERFQASNNSLQVLFYFKNAAPKSLKEINANELLKVEEFKKSLPPKNILYWDFDTCENFKHYLRLHIPKRIDTLMENVVNLETTKQMDDIVEEDDDLGLLDYRELFENFMEDSNISLEKIVASTEWIGTEIAAKADELNRMSKMPNPNKTMVTELFKRTAKVMEDYSKRIEIEIPIFFSSFEEAIKNGTRLLNLADDFATEETIQELEKSKVAMLNLRIINNSSRESMNSFYESIEVLPRIQKDINSAKKKVLLQVGDLSDKLQKVSDLIEEFSNETGSKIDKLKIALSKR